MEFSLISDPIVFDNFEDEWQSLLTESILPVPFLHPRYLKAWWQSKGGGEWPADARLRVVMAHENGRLIGIAPLFIGTKDGQTSLHFLGALEVSDYLDFIVRESDLKLFLGGLLDFVEKNPDFSVKALDLESIIDSSPSLPALEELAASHGLVFEKSVLQPSPHIDLPGDFETYLAGLGKKQRHEIRRKLRNADDGHETSWYFVEDSETLGSELQAFTKMMRNEEDKNSFLKPEMESFFMASAHAFFDLGLLRLAFLTIDGEKAAAYMSFVCCKKLLVYNSAHDVKWLQLSPGWVLLAKQIEWAISQGFEEVDMMRGNEVYKYRFGGVDRFVMRVRIG